jgi:hypothetical protein
MKLKLFFFFLLLSSLESTFAQGIRFNTYTGYVFDESFDLSDPPNYYRGTIKGGLQWGAGVEYQANKRYGIELSYLRHDAQTPVRKNGSSLKNDFDLGINYVLIGGNGYIKIAKFIEPYLGGQMGMAIFNIRRADIDLKTTKAKFALGIKTGLNFHITPNIGIKLQAQLLSTIQSIDAGFYVGTGGAGTNLSPRSLIMQIGLTSGLVFILPSEKKQPTKPAKP